MSESEKSRAAHDAFEGPRGILEFMATNTVAANLLMIGLLVGGFFMMGSVRQEVFPDTAADIVTISVPYPGASPSEVEQGVVLAIEEALSGIDGIKRTTATATEGAASVSVELLDGVDRDSAVADVQAAIDRVTSFPLDAERATVSLATRTQETVSVIFYGDVEERVLRNIADNARDALLQDARVTEVEVSEVRPLEISVEVPEANLRAYGLTLPAIATAIGNASVELPAGAIDTPSGEVLVRTSERRDSGAEFADITLLATNTGNRVTVGDIATVIDGFQDTDQAAEFNGQPASRVRVYRAGDQTPIELSEAVYDFLRGPAAVLPPGVQAEVWFDRSEMYSDRVTLLLKNAYAGLILVLLVLGLFLDVKLAFWVTLGIPISFLGGILLMPTMDVSFNMISLFAFILTLGIVVDDAIVVGEAVHHHQQNGLGPVQAAIAGVKEVAAPVIFSVLTTIIAFVPLLFVPGTSGRFIRNIPLIVIAVFIISLVESLLILPAHLAHSKPSNSGGLLGAIQAGQAKFTVVFDMFVERVYARALRPMVEYRYLTLAVAVSGLILTLGMVASGAVKFSYMPKVESDVINASLRMPFGTPPEVTHEVSQRLVHIAREIIAENGGEEAINRGIYASVGSGGESLGPRGGGGSGGHIASVAVNLVPSSERDITAAEFASQWRQRMGEVAGAELLTFKFSTGPSAGSPISVQLTHSNVATLEAAAERLAEHLHSFDGVTDIDSGVSLGKEQLDIELTTEGRSTGLTEENLARQLRAAFYGAEAVRQQRGRDEVRVYVRRPERERSSEFFLEQMMVRTPDGGEMPLALAATVTRGRAYTSISRINSRRVITVTADVDEDVAEAGAVSAAMAANFIPQLMADVPGLSYSFSGEQEDRADTGKAIKSGMQIALFAMFALMAVAFRSYVQPIIVMAAIPFGIVGAVLGHSLMGYAVSMLSMFGMVALSGVVVNDSLLLVTSINEMRASGMSINDAIVAGGMRRFRPIILTSLTTFLGLAPMVLETSVQARFLIPMALSLGFGVLFATVITLVIVPALYRAVEDMRIMTERLKQAVMS